jgi:hypothetical protein
MGWVGTSKTVTLSRHVCAVAPSIWCTGERSHFLLRCVLSMYAIELYNSVVTYKRMTAHQSSAVVLHTA